MMAGAFFLPMHILRLGPINFTFADAAFSMALLILAAQMRLNHLPFGRLTFLWCVGLSLFLGGLFISSVINGDPLRWLNIAAQYVFAWLLLPMIVMSQDRAFAHRCLLAFVVGVALSEAFGILVSHTLSYTKSAQLFGPGFVIGNGRLGAMSSEANWNAAVVAFALPVLINLIQARVVRLWQGIILLIALLWGLLASASFTGFGAAVIAVMIMFAISNAASLVKFGLPLVGGGMLYIITGMPLPAVFAHRVGGALQTGDIDEAGTFLDRSALIGEAWHMAGKNIIVGLGVDRYRDVSAFGAPVHNFPLLIINEGGIVAFAGQVTEIVLMWVLAISALKVNRRDGAMAIAVLAVFTVFISSIPHMYSRLWTGPVMLALAASYARQLSDRRGPGRWIAARPASLNEPAGSTSRRNGARMAVPGR